jgi:uncharacterized membrane protein
VVSAVAVRGARERAIQTLWLEGIGIAVVAPPYALIAGAPMQESAVLLVTLSLAVTG